MNFQRLTGEIKRLEALLANIKAKAASASTNGAPQGFTSSSVPAPATSQTFQSTAVKVGATGKLYWSSTASLGIGGGTTVAGEDMKFQAVLDGAPVAVFVDHQAMGTNGECSAPVLAFQGGLTPGATHTVGITATNATTGAHTFTWSSDGGAQVFVWAP